jgi:hypothetical protein
MRQSDERGLETTGRVARRSAGGSRETNSRQAAKASAKRKFKFKCGVWEKEKREVTIKSLNSC